MSTAAVLGQVARFHSLFGEDEAAIELGRESLRLAEKFGRDDLRAKNLITLGTAAFYRPDSDLEAALADVRAGIEVAAACGDFGQLSRGYVNAGFLLQQTGELVEAEAALLEAARLVQRRGYVPGMRFTEGNMIDVDLTLGRWEAAERRANAFLKASEQGSHYADVTALMSRSMIRLARDESKLARDDADLAATTGRRLKDPQVLVPALAMAAMVHAELGATERARSLLDELRPGPFIASVPAAFFAASRLELAEEFRARVREFGQDTRWDKAADAVLDGRWADAADVYGEIGARPFAALAALRAAEAYVSAGRRAEADKRLARALEFWRSVGAKRYVREGEALLAASA
jgi:tetratricopeptide (TPR) repeat protein